MTITHTSTHKLRTEAWALVCADKARVERCVWTFPPHSMVGVGEEQGWCKLRQRQNSHFPASQSRQLCGVSCPGSRGFPSALLVNTTWPRIHCGGAAGTDCGDRLLFSLCFHVEVRALWAFVCGGSWVGVGFQCDTHYSYNYSSGIIRLTKAFLPILLLSACFTPFIPSVGVYSFRLNHPLLSSLWALHPADPLFIIKYRLDRPPISTNWRTQL